MSDVVRDLRIAVVDDDYFKREHMAQELDAHPRIAVVHALPQDEAMAWSDSQWEEMDFAIVDVFDEYAPGEVGTDMYSGIPVIEKLRMRDVRTIAISPYKHHPLVEQRIYQAGANYLYRRYEVNDLDLLVKTMEEPQSDHMPQPVPRAVLKHFGAAYAKTNQAVAVYEQSALYGKLRPGIKQRTLLLPRRTIDRFSQEVRNTGFDGQRNRTSADRLTPYGSVRDYVLRLLGRLDSSQDQ